MTTLASHPSGKPSLPASLLSLVFLLFLSAAHADVLTVTTLADDIAAPPAGSLRKAIADAGPGDIINFQSGLIGTITLAGADLVVDKDLVLVGPGADVLAISANGSSRILNVAQNAAVTISGLSFRDGKATKGADGTLAVAAQPGGNGGAILSAGNLTVTGCVFSNNIAGVGGNNVTGAGGNTTFPNGGAGGNGGAIASTGSLSLTRSVFTANRAGLGGDYSFFSTPQNPIIGNGSGGSGGDGGAVYSISGSLSMVECSVISNQAGNGGNALAGPPASNNILRAGSGGSGGGVSASGTFLIDRCCIANNAAGNAGTGRDSGGGGSGGGLYLGADPTGQVTTSTISGNRAGNAGSSAVFGMGNGGGIHSGGNLTLTSCTITDNSAGKIGQTPIPGYGGGIWASGVTLRNTIIAGNGLPAPPVEYQNRGPDAYGTFLSEGHNLIGKVDQATGFDVSKADQYGTMSSPLDPLLAQLGDNGGPTQTHALTDASPAINAGDDSLSGTDQRGEPRHVGDHVDIGAFERSLPSIAFSVGSSVVLEGAGSATIIIQRNASIDTAATVHYSTVSGTATAGVDFASLSATIDFIAGQSEASVSVPILQDNVFEGAETFQLTLADALGNPIVGPNSKHTVTIADDEATPIFEFVSSSSTASETGGNILVVVKRTGSTNVSASLSYATENGNATAGTDYTSRSGSLSFTAGVTQQNIQIPILNDSIVEADESFVIRLSAPTNGAMLGAASVHTVTIQSDDVPPNVTFETASSTISESAGNALVKVKRTGPNVDAFSVSYQCSSGSAEANADFTSVSGTITFSDNAEHTFAIPISNDDLAEQTETFSVTLTNPTNGAALGANSTHTVTILDNDGPAIVTFANPTTSVSETSGEALVTILRTGNTSTESSVEVSATGGSALGGSDYSLQNATLTFPPGATERTVTLSINNDNQDESDEDIVLMLSNPTGASVGAQATHTLTILDDPADLPEIRRASYRGLAQITETDIPEFGGIVVKTTDAGRLTGTFRVRGKALRLHGRFSEDRTFSQEFSPRSLGGSGGGNIHLQPDEGGTVLRGTFNFGDGSTFVIEAQRDALGTRSNPVPDANAYTALLGTQLDGDPTGFLRAHVAPSGKVSLSARLPDGTRLSATSHLTENRSFPIFVPAYTRKSGYLAGPAQFDSANSLPLSGELHWKKPATSLPPYPAGFEDELVELSGAVYSPPRGQRILDDFDLSQGSAFLQLSGNEIPDVDLTWTERNRIRLLSPDAAQVRITLRPKTGLWNGSFRDNQGRRYKLHGICLQQQGEGEDIAAGFYLTAEGAYRVEIWPENQLN